MADGSMAPLLETEFFCRLCIECNTEKTLVFSRASTAALLERIFECTGVRLNDIAGIAQRICDVCTSQLVICERFIKQCREADQKLLELQGKRNSQKVELVPHTESESVPGIPLTSANAEGIPLKQNEIIVNQSSILNDRDEESYVVEILDADHENEIDLPGDLQGSDENDATRSISSKPISTSKSKGKKCMPKNQCQVCGTMHQNLKQHMLVHTGEKKHVCPFCPKAFSQKGNLTHHINRHTGNHPYKCDECDKAYMNPQSLRSHKLLHTDERKYHCEFCGATFKYRSSFSAHLRYHIQDRRHACNECGCTFISSSSLKKHMRAHTGERPYSCTLCNKSFKTSSNLSLHKVSHTKQRRFQCDYCECWFSYKNVLKTHMIIHLRERDKVRKIVDEDATKLTKEKKR